MTRRASDEASADLEVRPVAPPPGEAAGPPGPDPVTIVAAPPPRVEAAAAPAPSPVGGGSSGAWGSWAAGHRWLECRVRRVVDVPFASVAGAVGTLLGPGPATRFEPADVVARGPDEVRVHGRLRPRRCGRVVQVDVVVSPWSRTRTEVRLEPRGGRRPRAPDRYFDAAHGVVDGLRRAILRGCTR